MAKVIRVCEGYQFSNLHVAGMRLVNEFQRRFPFLCAPSQDPQYRLVHMGSPIENLELDRLVAEVRRLDPDTPPNTTFSKRV